MKITRQQLRKLIIENTEEETQDQFEHTQTIEKLITVAEQGPDGLRQAVDLAKSLGVDTTLFVRSYDDQYDIDNSLEAHLQGTMEHLIEMVYGSYSLTRSDWNNFENLSKEEIEAIKQIMYPRLLSSLLKAGQ